MTGTPTARRLSAYYFWYYAAAGALMPFLGLFLIARGCTPAQVGVITAVLATMRIATPYAWGALGDRSSRRMQLIQHALLAAIVALASLWLAPDFGWMVLSCVMYGLFIAGTVSQFEVVTFRHLAERSGDYPRIRLWASAGFVVAVLVMGKVFDVVPITTVPLWGAALFLWAWVGGRRIPEPPEFPHATEQGRMLDTLRQRPVQALLLTALLWQISCAPFSSFFSIYVEEHGYERTATGFLWAMAVGAEVVLLRFLPEVQARLGLRRMMLWCLGMLSARWVLQVLTVNHLPLLALVQTLQAISVAAVYVVSTALLQDMFPARLQGRGQAIFFGVSYGIGNAGGSLATGFLWERWPHEWLWFAASAVGVLSWFVAWRWLHPVSRKAAPLVATIAEGSA